MFNVLGHDEFFGLPGITEDTPLCRNWTQGAQNGLACTYNTPLKAWSGGVLTPNVYNYIFNLRSRWGLRLNGRNLSDPNLDFIATNGFGMSLPDAQHFCVRPLVDAAEMFPGNQSAIDCGRIALDVLQAYFIQAKVPYFRDGGKGPFGYSGRTRIAGWGVAGLADAVRLFRIFRANKAQWDLLLGQIARYVKVIQDNYPLIDLPDGPDGDHLNMPHVCVFNGGILARSLISLADALRYPIITDEGGPKSPDVAPLYQLSAKVCEEMVQAYDPDKRGFYYDLPYGPDKKPLPLDEIRKSGTKLQTGAGETHIWCASPFTLYVDRKLGQNSAVSTALDWQREKAMVAGFTDRRHPVEMIKSFEGWLP